MVWGFKKIRYASGRTRLFTQNNKQHPANRDGKKIGVMELETPPYIVDTMGLWIDVPRPTLELLYIKGFDPVAAIDSAQHAVMKLPLLAVVASAKDLKTACQGNAKQLDEDEDEKKKRPPRPAR